jgi:hypothetical protein
MGALHGSVSICLWILNTKLRIRFNSHFYHQCKTHKKRKMLHFSHNKLWRQGLPVMHCSFTKYILYEGVSKSYRSGRLERELQMVQFSANRFSCITALWVSLVSFTRHNPLCCFSMSVYCCKHICRYRHSPETLQSSIGRNIFRSPHLIHRSPFEWPR